MDFSFRFCWVLLLVLRFSWSLFTLRDQFFRLMALFAFTFEFFAFVPILFIIILFFRDWKILSTFPCWSSSCINERHFFFFCSIFPISLSFSTVLESLWFLWLSGHFFWFSDWRIFSFALSAILSDIWLDIVVTFLKTLSRSFNSLSSCRV